LVQAAEVTSVSLPGEASPEDWGGRAATVTGDIADPATLAQVRGPLDAIVHLAAPVGVAGEYERQWRVMVDGTREACALAARSAARLVVASSIAVYGSKIRSQTCREPDGFGPWQGAYGRAKQGQESVALEDSRRDGFPLVIVRPANVYGLGGASAWGDRLLESIRATGGAVVGDAARNNAGLTYVENLADALWAAAIHPAAVGRIYNVCDGLDVTWRRFMDDMAALAGRPPPPAFPLEPVLALATGNEDPERCVPPRDASLPFLEALNLVAFDNRIDASAIREELGWRPVVGYEAAFEEMRSQLSAPAPPTPRTPWSR
jgi:nucleoside-diphosphate-sugar epimerase